MNKKALYLLDNKPSNTPSRHSILTPQNEQCRTAVFLETLAMSEAEIWSRFRSGDQDAFADVYNLYVDDLYRYGMKMVDGNRDLVIDAIHDVFVKLYELNASSTVVLNPRFYLLKVLRGQILDNLRKERGLKRADISRIPFTVEYRLSNEEFSSAEQQAEMFERYRQVVSAMTERQKEAIYLHYSLGLSYDEVAALMDMNVQSVRNLIHRSVERIRKMLKLSTFLFFST